MSRERLAELFRCIRELFAEREPLAPGGEFLTQTGGDHPDVLKMVNTVLGNENVVTQGLRVPGEVIVENLNTFGVLAAAQIARSRIPQCIGFEHVDPISRAMQGPCEKARAAA